jgi:hypothetical protein
MKKIEPEIVLAKLDFMTDYLDSLSTFESITLEDYLSDRGKQLAIERLLQLIIQVAKVKLPDENLSIGIILCKSKNKTIVEYALRESNKPIGVASYKVVSTVPNELKHQLPAPEQVAKLLQGID